jgi:glycosyltransferase involved in cell wall biosynthesis
MHKIDFHVLKHPIYPRYTRVFSHPKCNIHQIDGIKNHIGQGRCIGFQQGTAEYVSFYDDDDDVLPEHLDQIIKRLDDNQHLTAIATEQNVINSKGIVCRKQVHLLDKEQYKLKDVRYIHQLVVIRRSALTSKYLDLLNQCNDWCEFALYTQMILDGHVFQHFNKVCYNWYLHTENVKSLKIKPSLIAVNLVRTMMGGPPLTQIEYDGL